MILVNGKPEDRINVTDRGLQYGDGLFETIAFRNGIAEFVEQHFQRLLWGCERLKIPFQHIELLRNELDSVYQDLNDSDAVIKIIITRGCGGRGYFADSNVEPTRIISTHAYPSYPENYSQKGICVRLCRHTLSENSNLAGIKHLNRLDNVLARNEWTDLKIAEGLMFNQSNQLIEGTMSNVFIVKSNHLMTPLLNKSGVLGVIRAQLIQFARELGFTVEEKILTQDDLLDADEAFVCNSINGIWPIVSITDSATTYPLGPITQQLQQALLHADK